MRQFIDRTAELEFLDSKYRSSQAELVVLYGRRRIGKTELVLRFAEGMPKLYFLGRLESRADTIRRFNNSLVEHFKDTRLLTRPLRTWDDILDYLADQAKSRQLVILDEFPFLVERFPEIVSVMQDKWDSTLRNTMVKLVLSGSSVGMMEKHALSYKSPLYGRRTGQWQVRELEVRHLSEFFPRYTPEDLVLVYSILDTIPGYLAKFSPKASVWQNVEERILSKGEFLYDEVDVLLLEELRDPSNYMSILSAIAGGTTTFAEVHSRTQLDKSLLSKYIYVLGQLGMVERVTPVTETFKGRLKGHGGLYVLRDNFLDFWFRFVYLNRQALEQGRTKVVLDEIQKEMNGFAGRKFERFVRSLLPRLEIIPVTRVGLWWHKGEEVDVVGLDEKGHQMLLGECKWQEDVDASEAVSKLRIRSELISWHRRDRTEQYAVFAKSFRRRVREPGVHCMDLRELFAEAELGRKGTRRNMKLAPGTRYGACTQGVLRRQGLRQDQGSRKGVAWAMRQVMNTRLRPRRHLCVRGIR